MARQTEGDARPARRPGLLARRWAWVTVAGALCGSFVFTTSDLYRGLGIGREGGRFLMRQGARTAEVNQVLGVWLWIASLALPILVLTSAVLSIAVHFVHDTLSPARLFPGRENAGYRWAVRLSLTALIATLSLTLSLLILAMTNRQSAARRDSCSVPPAA